MALQHPANISKVSPNRNDFGYGYELDNLDGPGIRGAQKRHISSPYPPASHQTPPKDRDIERDGTGVDTSHHM
jgi:hypothetical protein